jgi:hypothetical protein
MQQLCKTERLYKNIFEQTDFDLIMISTGFSTVPSLVDVSV